MKFKMQDKQNQLIERISDKHLVVGVDIVFPELRQVFKDITAKGAIATLRLFPSPIELRSLKPHVVVSGWKSIMKRQPG
jgi:preprotein translocase subunit SecB